VVEVLAATVDQAPAVVVDQVDREALAAVAAESATLALRAVALTRTMAEPTPWPMARPALPTVRTQERYGRDLYNFTATSVSQGTNNPVVSIPSMGPHAAGAIPPTKYPEVVAVEVIITGSIGPEYGVNSHQPS